MVEYLKRYTTYNSMQYLVILATISTHELLFFSNYVVHSSILSLETLDITFLCISSLIILYMDLCHVKMLKFGFQPYKLQSLCAL